jgi:GT2 family glycosyltransferase
VSTAAVSVVVPTKDRPEELASCLEALGRLDYPRELLEVIVVDDGGGADLEPVRASAPAGLTFSLIRREPGGPAAARNTGADAAQGELLAFTDDDCLPERGWLRALSATLAEAPGAACGGRTLNALPANAFSEASAYIQELVYAHYNADAEAARFFASNNLAVPRDAFRELRGFDAERFPRASEDRDFCDRWLASGRALRYAPGAVVHHARDLDLRGFVRQHVAYGRGAARYHRARAARSGGRMRDDMAFHLNRALWSRTLALRPARRAGQMAALLALWQVANTAGYALERRSALKRGSGGTE